MFNVFEEPLFVFSSRNKISILHRIDHLTEEGSHMDRFVPMCWLIQILEESGHIAPNKEDM